MNEVLQFLLPIATLGIGWFLARSREIEKDRQDKKLAVYAEMLAVMALTERVDFKRISDRVFKGEILESVESAFFTDVIERFNRSHLQLMVFGSAQVITAISDFYENEEREMIGSKKEQYIQILTSMRSDGFAKDYSKFHEHVDNILISGPVGRRARITARLESETKEE